MHIVNMELLIHGQRRDVFLHRKEWKSRKVKSPRKMMDAAIAVPAGTQTIIERWKKDS